MKLSIVTINYNNVGGLRRTLASVATQTYRNIEHIIVDAVSTDGSVDVIREYESSNSLTPNPLTVKWSSEKDEGIYDGMNKGIRRATGDYIWILNSGDCVANPNTIEQLVAVLENNTVDILLGNMIRVYPNGKKVFDAKRVKSATNATPRPLETSMLTFYRSTVPQDAAFVRRDLFGKYGYFDEKLKICADWKLYLNMIALGEVQPMYVNIDVVLFDMSGISNENHDLRLAERRAYLKDVLPASVLKDYDAYAFPIEQYKRLKKYHIWGLVYFIERVFFKFEKWHILK